MREYENIYYGLLIINDMLRLSKKRNISIFDLNDFKIWLFPLANKAYSTFSLKRMQSIFKYIYEVQQCLFKDYKTLPNYGQVKNELRRRMSLILMEG